MDLFGFLKGFFLPPNRENRPGDNPRSQFLKTDQEDELPDDPNQFPRNDDVFGFQIFSNPIEMQKYFEKQMQDMLKSFGFHHDDSFFGFNDGNSIGTQFGGYLEEPDQNPSSSGSLRDQYLKPGFQEPHRDVTKRSDTDLDGQIQPNDLDSIFKEKTVTTPFQPPQSLFRSFGQSISSKTIRNSDGSIETHRTVKDSQGNEETVVTKKWGDKEYTLTTKIDKDGKQVIMKDLKNMDEKDLEGFLNKNGDNLVPKNPQNWFPFDKYFS